MKTVLCLEFAVSKQRLRASFKQPALYALILEYLERASKFSRCELSGAITRSEKRSPKKSAQVALAGNSTVLWLCDLRASAKALSSNQLALEMQRLEQRGVKELVIAIGSADGWEDSQIAELQPSLLWSFGPLTLPHELAALVAAEQIYRARSILAKTPYHLGH